MQSLRRYNFLIFEIGFDRLIVLKIVLITFLIGNGSDYNIHFIYIYSYIFTVLLCA